MKSIWLLITSLAVMLAAGCSPPVDGAAKPMPVPTRRSVTGQSVDHVLLGTRALSRILKQSLDIDPRVPPRFGGAEELQDAGTALPDECLGVAAMLQQNVYSSSDVKEVAVETWRHAALPADVTSVQEGVVSLPTAADADALFGVFSRQWRKCDGTTTSLPGSVFLLKGKITNVQVSSSILAATVSTGWTSRDAETASETIPAGRAIGVRGNCLIEVEVDFFNSANGSRRGPNDFDNAATDIARAMMGKIGALS
jgi:PknH-like extracellular domain